MYFMSIIAWISSSGFDSKTSKKLDTQKCIKIALVHDMAESIVGDLTPNDNVSKEEKSKRESEAMQYLSTTLGGGPIALEFLNLWEEYENCSSLEASLVKQIDKFEMALQAYYYELNQPIDLGVFYKAAFDKVEDETLKLWLEEILKYRLKNLPNLPILPFK